MDRNIKRGFELLAYDMAVVLGGRMRTIWNQTEKWLHVGQKLFLCLSVGSSNDEFLINFCQVEVAQSFPLIVYYLQNNMKINNRKYQVKHIYQDYQNLYIYIYPFADVYVPYVY